MIALFCVLIILGAGRCDDVPSRIEVESSINRTIDEVEKLIREDATLPRLTRHEIVDILFNITSKDVEAHQSKETIEKARKLYQKALMVVLPYNAEDAKGNIKDLYTKPPIVRIIADSDSGSQDFATMRGETLQSSTFAQETRGEKQPLDNLVVAHASEKTSPKESPHAKTRHKNHKETYSEVQRKEALKLDSAPVKFSFNLENLQKQPTITEESATKRRPVFQGSPSTKDEEVFIVYSTSATMRPVETSSKGISIGLEEPQTTALPLSYSPNILSSDQWRYNAPPSTTRRTTTTPTPPTSTFFEKVRDEPPFLPTVRTSPEDAARPMAMSKAEETSTISKVTGEKTRMTDAERPASVSAFVAPASSPSSSSEKTKYSSTYNLNSGGFRRITTSTTTTPTTTTTMRSKVMDLLASIGLRPENTTNVEEVFKENRENLETMFQIPSSNGFVYTTTSGLTAVAPGSPSIAGQNTFENPVSELGQGMNNLTPDVQLLFQRFGLQTSNLATTSTTSTPRPTVNTNFYTNFKPLPTSSIKDQDMKEFLARFGLGVSDNRRRKAMPEATQRPSLIEVIPGNMRKILENIGLISRKAPPTNTRTKSEDARPTAAATKVHVFKPHEVQLKDEGQRMKINELLDTVRLVQEGKASVKDVRRVADDLLATTKTLKDGPDPLSLEEIIRVYNEDVKNEVKRQPSPQESAATADGDREAANTSTTTSSVTTDVPTTTTTTTTTTTATTTTTTTTIAPTTDSAKDGSDFLDASAPTPVSSTSTATNLIALEESFGGTTSAPDPVLPTKRKSGLYFLVDWNTFLEVGDDDSQKVNLRFQPKVGDRTRFLPVNVP